MPADIAALTGMSWINHDHRDACTLCLILDKEAQLCEGPSRHLGALRLLKPCTLTYPPKVFHGEPTSGVFGSRNERLADTVIDIAPKTSFSTLHTRECPADVFGAFAVHLCHMGRPLQACPTLRVAGTTRFDLLPSVCCRIARRGQIRDTQIDAQKVRGLQGCDVGYDNSGVQIPLRITIDNIDLPGETLHIPSLILTIDHGDNLTPLEGQQADVRRAFPSHQPLIVDHGAIRPEHWADRPVAFEDLDCFANGAHSHLGRQPKAVAQLTVTPCMNRGLGKDPGLKTDTGRMGCSGIKGLHRLQQRGMLLRGWKQFELECKLHIHYRRIYIIHSQEKTVSAMH